MDKEEMQFSVLICVYCKDNPKDFDTALRSVANQTLVPNEIVIVCDGPLSSELDDVIDKFAMDFPFTRVHRLETNQGHGNARRYGIEKCTYDLIALMDADDISVEDRFEKQINIFRKNPQYSIVGGQIYEFSDNIANVVGKRELPENDEEIKNFMKKRCPMNQVTVMFKKQDVIDSGNYIDWYCEEDYYLWIRMALKEFVFYNIQENLVFVRVNNGMIARRGGWKYFKSEARIQKFMLDSKIINVFQYIYNVGIRLIAEVIIPDGIRSYLYKVVLRK